MGHLEKYNYIPRGGIKVGRYERLSQKLSTKKVLTKQIEISKPINDTFRNKAELDPRCDLQADHHHWVRVLHNAAHCNMNLFRILHGIRCGGGFLNKTSSSYKLLPGEWTMTEWDEIKKKYLDSIRTELVKVFKISSLGKVVNEEIPDDLFRQAEHDIDEHQQLTFGTANKQGGD